eukprot:Sspe_Gene.84670::Locus_55587_Transcript_1_5_Confidence_0.692_Length_755::g.84670::m.84670
MVLRPNKGSHEVLRVDFQNVQAVSGVKVHTESRVRHIYQRGLVVSESESVQISNIKGSTYLATFSTVEFRPCVGGERQEVVDKEGGSLLYPDCTLVVDPP